MIFFISKNLISIGGKVCSTGGALMAMNGIPNNLPPDFSHRWPGIQHIWPSLGSVELTWQSVRSNGVSVWGRVKRAAAYT